MKLHTVRGLLEEPPTIRYLADGIIVAEGLHGIVGPSGSGKSCMAGTLAYRIAQGKPFAGRATKEGGSKVLLIAAEGRAGLPLRVRALVDRYGEDGSENLRVVLGAVELHTPDGLRDIIDACKADEFIPELVFIDTWAATSPAGFDENSAAHFGEMVAGIRHLQGEFACAFALIHHTGHDQTRERGTSAFRAALDVLLLVERAGERTIRVITSKARDAAPAAPFALSLVPVGGSIVAELAGQQEVLSDSLRRVLSELHRSELALSPSEWMARTGVKESRFYQLKAELVKLQLVEESKRGQWVPTPEGVRLIILANEKDRTPIGVRSDSDRNGRAGKGATPTISPGLKDRRSEAPRALEFGPRPTYEQDERRGMELEA